ncbi:MAG: PKD domain-containing protein, partial [Bacteroidota bacterium]
AARCRPSSLGTTFNTPSVTYTYADTGTYIVQMTTESDQGCIDSVQHIVMVHPNPEPDFDVSFACFGDSSHFTDLSTIGSGSIDTWDWNFGDGNTSNLQNPSHLYQSWGTFNVTLTVTSEHNCVRSVTQPIERPPRPPAPLVTHDTVCAGFGASLSAYSNFGTLEWFYSSSSSTPFHTGPDFQTGPIVTKTVYWVQVVSDEGCRSDMVGVVAAVNDPPDINVNISSQSVEIPNAIVEFTVTNPNQAVVYAWTFGDGSASTAHSPVHQYTEEGSYWAHLIASDRDGCTHEYDFGPIEVTQFIALYVPNIFTPNGDGNNDYFSVTPVLITDLEIRIFDRWGKEVFHSEDMNFKWEGTFGGQPLQEGAYAYRIQATAWDGKPVEKSGTITIVR